MARDSYRGGECEKNITHRHVGLVLCVAVQKASLATRSHVHTIKLLTVPRSTAEKPVASSQRPPPCSEIMSNSLASARMASAGQAMPLEAARNRSTAMMHKLHVLEDKYVKDWSQRIDLEVGSKYSVMITGHASKHVALQVRSKGDMGQHIVQDACKQMPAAVLRLTEHPSQQAQHQWEKSRESPPQMRSHAKNVTL
ncbi:Mettl7b [Symbiodinium sp. CCMP2592]|nr:Mettl7b [Symbiodinium sp. CCMP2592]